MDQAVMQDLYQHISKYSRSYLRRRFGTVDLDDRVHNIFLTVAEAVRDGRVRDVKQLGAYAFGVSRLQAWQYIHSVVAERRRRVHIDLDAFASGAPGPEREAMSREKCDFAARVLRTLPQRQGEVLIRLIFDSESKEQICAAMDLSETQFRLAKSRGMARVRQRFSQPA